MKGNKTVYVCSACDHQTPKWLGQCPACGAWNTLEEETYTAPAATTKTAAHALHAVLTGENRAVPFDEAEIPSYMRSQTGIGELDRVLGGGLVHGSVVLLSGEPGIGKSTMLLQICAVLGQSRKILYVSGEESRGQLKLRADRLHIGGAGLFLLTETSLDGIMTEYERVKPDVVIVDSIQTMYSDKIASAPGSVSQVRECALSFIARAKADGTSVFLVGHVNKEGGIAGPKVLEHMVDAVLYFEGERRQSYRIIRAIKNRYGSTNEIGVFEMTDEGLREVENPSAMLLEGRPVGVSGSCAVCVMEGTRPIIAEIQALVTETVFPAPRRTSNGVDYNRACLLLAVLEKRLGLKFATSDVYLNVIGGLRLDEPSADLAVAVALISGLKDRAVPDDLIAIGELGLAGECRSVSGIEQRLRESARMGFRRILIPHRNMDRLKLDLGDVEIVPVKSLYDAVVRIWN